MATTAADLPRIVHVGPGLAVRGGVSAVERLIIGSIRDACVNCMFSMSQPVFCAL